jgi:hypothetical protein
MQDYYEAMDKYSLDLWSESPGPWGSADHLGNSSLGNGGYYDGLSRAYWEAWGSLPYLVQLDLGTVIDTDAE